MRVCTTLIALRPRNLHDCFRQLLTASACRGVLRNSIKLLPDSVPLSRARNNGGIEFQGNVIATVLFAASYRRHDHYFSNYDVSRLPCNPDHRQRWWKTAMRWVGIAQRICPFARPRRPHRDEKSEKRKRACACMRTDACSMRVSSKKILTDFSAKFAHCELMASCRLPARRDGIHKRGNST